MVLFAVQILKSVRTMCISYISISRRVRLGIGLTTPDQESVVLHTV